MTGSVTVTRSASSSPKMATVSSRLGAFTAEMVMVVKPTVPSFLFGAVTAVFTTVSAAAITACVLTVEESDGRPSCTPFSPIL